MQRLVQVVFRNGFRDGDKRIVPCVRCTYAKGVARSIALIPQESGTLYDSGQRSSH